MAVTLVLERYGFVNAVIVFAALILIWIETQGSVYL